MLCFVIYWYAYVFKVASRLRLQVSPKMCLYTWLYILIYVPIMQCSVKGFLDVNEETFINNYPSLSFSLFLPHSP